MNCSENVLSSYRFPKWSCSKKDQKIQKLFPSQLSSLLRSEKNVFPIENSLNCNLEKFNSVVKSKLDDSLATAIIGVIIIGWSPQNGNAKIEWNGDSIKVSVGWKTFPIWIQSSNQCVSICRRSASYPSWGIEFRKMCNYRFSSLHTFYTI